MHGLPLFTRGVARWPKGARATSSREAFVGSAKALGPRTLRFAEWIDPQLPVNRTLLARFEGAGNGLVAAEALPAGSTVLEVPREVWWPLSAIHARAQAMAGAPHFVEQVAALAHKAMGRDAGGGGGGGGSGGGGAGSAGSGVGSAAAAAAAADGGAALSENVGALVGSDVFASEDGMARGIENLQSSVFLTMHLLFEMGDDDAPAAPYLEFMATAVPVDTSPLFWAAAVQHQASSGSNCEERLRELAGTRLLASSRKRAAALGAMHGALFGGGGGGGPSLDMFLFALTAILSRAISHQGMLYTMVPLLDCLNHDPAPGCAHRIDPATQSFVVETTRAHAAGEQLCISYNDNGNDALLRLYGFTLPDNPHDTLPLPAPEWPDSGGGGAGGAGGEAAPAAIVMHSRDCEVGPIPTHVLELMVGRTGGDVADAAGRFRRPIEQALAAYAGGPDLQRDLSLLAREEQPLWLRTCVQLRAGEKQILHAALGQLVALETAATEPPAA